MAWKEVTTSFATPWKPEKKGDALEGNYLGQEDIPSKQGNDSVSFVSYRVRKADGAIWGVAGAMLDSKINQVPIGTKIRIEFQGTTKLASGRTGKDFKLMVDETVTLLDPLLHSQHSNNNQDQDSFPPTAHA